MAPHIVNSIERDDRALAVAEPYGLWSVRAIVTGNIARIRAARSEYLSAVSMGRQALEMARRLGAAPPTRR